MKSSSMSDILMVSLVLTQRQTIVRPVLCFAAAVRWWSVRAVKEQEPISDYRWRYWIVSDTRITLHCEEVLPAAVLWMLKHDIAVRCFLNNVLGYCNI